MNKEFLKNLDEIFDSVVERMSKVCTLAKVVLFFKNLF